MKKSIFFPLFLISLLFISCENFLSGSFLKDKIDGEIQYSNTPDVTVLVSAQEGTGSTIPGGNHLAKVGYAFDVSFSENPEYKFIRWIAVSKDDSSKIITNGVEIDKPKNMSTSVKVSVPDVRITAECIKRIAIVGEPTPRYAATGVSRDRAIMVEFSRAPSVSSFIFTEDEIPATAEFITNDAGDIYAYKFEGNVYFKNISITNADDISMAQHFKQPYLDGNILKIETDPANPITIDTGSNYKTIKVVIGDDIEDKDGIKIFSGKEWRYQVTEATDEKATINIACNNKEGSISNAGQKEYSIGQRINLSFVEDALYQFVRWDYDETKVSIAEPNTSSTYAIVKEKVEADSPSTIKAVCAPRLVLENYTPYTTAEKSVFSKDSTIVLTFNQNLPTDADGIAQLDKINISVGGTPVKSSFNAPKIYNNTITFEVDKTNMISIPAGQTKTVTVIIPEDFYYVLDDEVKTKITYGGSGKTFNYKINETTNDKAEITYVVPTGAGTLNQEAGQTYNYSIGQEIPLSFKLNSGWIFNEWKITDSAGNEIPESKILISDKESTSTKLYIFDKVTAVKISADCSEDFVVTGVTPTAALNPKDTQITITFNKNINTACSSLLNKIRISIAGSSVDSYFTTRSISGKTITIKNTGFLNIEKGITKQITVTVPKDFYYTDSGNRNVALSENYVFDYTVSHETTNKAKLKFAVINGKTSKAFDSGLTAAIINQEESTEFSLGEEVALEANLQSGYQFYGWKIINSSGTDVSSAYLKIGAPKDASTVLYILQPIEDVTVQAICYRRPTVESYSPYSENSADEFAKNSPIQITFTEAIYSGCEKFISMEYTGSNFSRDNNYSRSLDSTNKIVTFTNKVMPELIKANETIKVIFPHNQIYYYANDKTTKIFMDDNEDYSFEVKINNKTMTNSTIRFAVDAASESSIKSISVDDTLMSSGSKETYNIQQTLNLNYNMPDGYKFDGYKIEVENTNYTVSKTGYATSGTITVKNGTKTYLSMTINGTAATVTVNDAIGNGANGYGLTITAGDKLIPAIVSVSPGFKTEGVRCDEPITVVFNKTLQSSTLTLGSSSSYAIQIVNSNNESEHWYTYYNKTVSGNTLTLTPKYTIKNALVPNPGDIKDVKIKLNPNLIKDSSAMTLSSTETGWTYRINSNYETVEPEIKSFEVYKPKYNEGVAVAGEYYGPVTAVLKGNAFNNSTELHFNNKVYFYGVMKDADSGIKQLIVRETLLRYSSDTEDLATPIKSPDVVYSYNSYFKDSTTYSGYKELKAKTLYTLQSQGDGLVQLDFILEDYQGNSVTKTYYVFKDTSLDDAAICPGPFLNTANPIPEGRSVSANRDHPSGSSGTGTIYFEFNDPSQFNEQIKFDFSKNFIKDLYASNGSRSIYSEVYVTVKWGTSSTSFPYSITKNSDGYYVLKKSSVSDPTSDIYFQFTVRDEVGNQNTLVRCMPGTSTITEATVNQYSISADENQWYITPRMTNYESKKTMLQSVGADSFDYLVLYRYKAPGSSTWSNYRASSTSGLYTRTDFMSSKFTFYYGVNYWKPTTYRPLGTYQIYVIPYFKYAERFYWGFLSAPITVTYTSNETGPVVSGNEITSGPTLPTGLYAGINSTPASTGYHRIYVYPTSYTKTSGYTYYYWYDNGDGKKNYVPVSTSSTSTYFNVPSGYTYSFGVKAVHNSTNNYKITESLKSLACTYDNIPPDITTTNYRTVYQNPNQANGFQLSSGNTWPRDTGSGLYTNSKGEIEFDYYFIKNDVKFNTSAIAPLNITLDDLDDYSSLKRTMSYSSDATYLNIPYEGLDEGIYTLAIHLKDKNGNEGVYNLSTVKKSINSKFPSTVTVEPVSYYSDSTQKISKGTGYSVKVGTGTSLSTGINYSALDMTTGKWSKIISLAGTSGSGASNPKYFSNDSIPTSVYFVSKSGVTSSYATWVGKHNDTDFMKLFFNNVSSSTNYGVYYPIYIYPKYDITKGTPSELICNSKNLIDGANCVQVFYDNAMFIHTMYSHTDLGNNPEKWEVLGIENNLVTKKDCTTYKSGLGTQKNFTYFPETDEEKIPEDYYYMIIAHFADGTVAYSSVHKK